MDATAFAIKSYSFIIHNFGEIVKGAPLFFLHRSPIFDKNSPYREKSQGFCTKGAKKMRRTVAKPRLILYNKEENDRTGGAA